MTHSPVFILLMQQSSVLINRNVLELYHTNENWHRCSWNELYLCVLQISTSVRWTMEVVTQEPIAATLKEISRARASQDTGEMDSPAKVGYNNTYR